MQPRITVPPPVVCERLGEIVRRFNGRFMALPAVEKETGEFVYPLPAHASDEVGRFLVGFSYVERDVVSIAHIPRGRVFGAGVVLSPDGRSIARDVSPDFGKPFAEHWLRTYGQIKPPTHLEGRTAVVAVTLGMGYGHWLLEELPRLLLLRNDPSVDAFILHRGVPFIEEALDCARLRPRLIAARRYSHFECNELVVPPLVGGEGRPLPVGVRLLREFAMTLIDRRESTPSSAANGAKLYISRADAGRRRLANEAELAASLRERGFTFLQLEQLTWRQQINAFARARVIVSPHGAGLANLAFCAPGARVVELFNRDYVNPCYWRLAAVAGLDYRPIVSAGDGSLLYEHKANRKDIIADVAAVTRALNAS